MYNVAILPSAIQGYMIVLAYAFIRGENRWSLSRQPSTSIGVSFGENTCLVVLKVFMLF